MAGESPQDHLEAVLRILERHRVLESLVERQQTSRRDLLSQMQRRENLVELRRYVTGMHPADLASTLTSLPMEQRLLVFRQLTPEDAGLTLLELEAEVRDAMLGRLEHAEIAASAFTLDADDLALIAPSLPPEIFRQAADALHRAGRSPIVHTSVYPVGTVGRLMRHDALSVRSDLTAADTIDLLRASDEIPPHTDRVFVVDARHVLLGGLSLQDLIRAAPSTPVAQLAKRDLRTFAPQDPAQRAAQAFERCDLVSAPVVDRVGKLVGRVTIEGVVDHVRAATEQDALARAGLRNAEDLFAPVSQSVKNRWPWLAMNLVTAFAASRIIAMFEDTILQVVALAALMPVVASIGGNTGNQTVALVIRALALDQLRETQGRLALKELTVGAINGVAWGTIVGLLAFLLYHVGGLAVVMAAAVFLNLVVAAIAGVGVPLALRWAGRDPVHGASVILTFITDGMGFLLILGLARMLLL